jgi:hypothetical protein
MKRPTPTKAEQYQAMLRAIAKAKASVPVVSTTRYRPSLPLDNRPHIQMERLHQMQQDAKDLAAAKAEFRALQKDKRKV